MANKKTIKVWYDPNAMKGGKWGAYRSVINENPGTRGCGVSPEDSVRDILITAASHDLSGSHGDYEYDYSGCPDDVERRQMDSDAAAVSSLLAGIFRPRRN
jgi:hypothetical protein